MKSPKLKNLRLNLVFLLFFFLFGIVSIRLFYIQVIKHDYYSAMADEQHWDYHKLPARRGTIYTADGFPLASTELNYLLYAEPKRISDSEGLAQKLTPIIEPDKFASAAAEQRITAIKNMELDLENKLSLDLFWVALKHDLTKDQKAKIEDLDVDGLGFEEEPARFYPEGETMACHVLGFVAQNEEGLEQGYYGLEGYYDGDLRGREGRIYEETAASGEPILVGGYRRLPAENGRDIVLTIDRSVQFLMEQKIREGVDRFDAKSGTGVVLNPKTGGVIAMVNYPAFDLSDKTIEEDEVGEKSELAGDQERRNLAIASTYEPGSVMKALTMAAGIDTRKITPRTEFNDSGPIEASGYWVDNWDKRHHGIQNMVQVLQKSNNCGAAFVAEKLGVRELREYFLKFGLGKVAGIDLEGEDTGIVKPTKEWREIDLLTASFGQGISATPLQMVSAFSTIVNNGVLMKPYVVSEIREDGYAIKVDPQVVRRVISESSSRVVVDMLTAAVEEGESKFYNLKEYRVAGKTGTAQIPIGGKYDPHKTNATFIGFFPSNPRFVMLIKFEEPASSVYAADTAVPVWMEIARELAAYYNIVPDK